MEDETLLGPQLPPDMPSKIGPYAIVDLLGKGGMGQVWLGQQFEPVPRRAAVKVVAQGAGLDILRRFDEERRLLAGLEHPAIAKVFEVGTTEDGRPWFAMEYVQGEAIHSFCRQNGLSLPQRLELFRRVCLAVQHAHARGIVHRDLKPSNILVEYVDDDPLPKIIDFGVAKALDGRADNNPLRTAFGGFIGTPAYASPEQAGGDPRQIDVRADVYSLGAVLYQILTDVPPFDPALMARMTSLELQRTIAEQDPPPPSKRAKTGFDLAALDGIVLCALQKKRDKRFANAGELASAIEGQLGVRSVPQRAKRRPWLPWIGAASLLAFVLAWTLLLNQGSGATPGEGDKRKPVSSSLRSAGEPASLGSSSDGPVGIALARIDDVLRLTWEARMGVRTGQLFQLVQDAAEPVPANPEAFVELAQARGAAARDLEAAQLRAGFFAFDMSPGPVAPRARRGYVIEFFDDSGYRSLSRIVWEPAWRRKQAPFWRALPSSVVVRSDRSGQLGARPCALHCNDDGWPELIAVRNGIRVERFLASGAGRFVMDPVGRDFSVGQNVIAVRTCNVEGDRAADLIVATRDEIFTLANELALAKGVEKPDFSRYPKTDAEKVQTQLEGGQFTSFDIGDANGDRLVDLAVVERAGKRAEVTLYFGTHHPDNPFHKEWKWLGNEQSRRMEIDESEVVSLAFTDLDGDGRDELVVARTKASGAHEIQVTAGGANLRSSVQRSLSRGAPPFLGRGRSVFLDYDGDLRVDMITRHEGRLHLRRGLGDGMRFEAAKPLTDFGHSPILQIDSGDFDRDGVRDLLFVRDKSGDVPALCEVLIGRRDSDSLRWMRDTSASQVISSGKRLHAAVPTQLDGDEVTDFLLLENDSLGMRVRSVLGSRAPRLRDAHRRLPHLLFAGERRGAFFAADVVPGPHPGVQSTRSHVLAVEAERILYVEGASERRSARTLGVAQRVAKPLKLRDRFFARLLDRVGRELVALDEDGALAIEVFPRGGRPTPQLDAGIVRGTRFDSVSRARFGGDLDSLVVQEGSQLRVLRVRGGRLEDSGAVLRLRDVPERVYLADFDGNGLDDVLALRSMRTGETEYELHFTCFGASQDRPSFYSVLPRRGPNRAPRLSFDGRVTDLALVPHGARVGYDDLAYKKALLLGYEAGSFQILDLHSVYAELPPWRLVDTARHNEVYPDAPLRVLSADFNGDGLKDLALVRSDGSEIELRMQDKEDLPGTPRGRGSYSTHTRKVATPWRGDASWTIEALLALRYDCDAKLDLGVLARHESGKMSFAVWYVRQ